MHRKKTSAPGVLLFMSRFASAVLLLISFILLLTTLFGNRGVLHLIQLKARSAENEQRNRELESGIAAYSKKVRDLDSSLPALEKTAREELGLSRPGEVIYFFDEKDPNQPRK